MITLSPEDRERIRQPPPLPFAKWTRTQRLFFAWVCSIAWVSSLLAIVAFLFVAVPLPECIDSSFFGISLTCRATGSVALLFLALSVLIFLYYRFMILISQIAYFPPYPNYYGE
jgi:hypothetical protein